MAEWDRELFVDVEAVRRAAGSPGRWRLLGTGWDCDAWLADESVVWRVPRRAVGIDALKREAAVMPILALRLPSKVPVPRLVEAPGLPTLAAHDLIPGRELAEVEESPGLGAALGVCLRALHAPSLPSEVRTLLPVDPLGRGDPAKRVAMTHRKLDDVADRIDPAPLRHIVEEGQGPPLPLDAVTHGDLHFRHVMVGEGGALSGMIDWGDCCIGARAVDLACVTALGPDSRRAFFDAYGEVDERSWRHARLMGVLFGAALLAADREGSVGRSARRWLERLSSDGSRGVDTAAH